MSKLLPVEPVLENPELVVPAIVTVKAIETARNLDTLHDAYGRSIGIYEPTPVPPTFGTTLSQGSQVGTYIASPLHRGPDGKWIVPTPPSAPLNPTSTSGTYIASPPSQVDHPLPIEITQR